MNSTKMITVQYSDNCGEYIGEDNKIYLIEKEDGVIL